MHLWIEQSGLLNELLTEKSKSLYLRQAKKYQSFLFDLVIVDHHIIKWLDSKQIFVRF